VGGNRFNEKKNNGGRRDTWKTPLKGESAPDFLPIREIRPKKKKIRERERGMFAGERRTSFKGTRLPIGREGREAGERWEGEGKAHMSYEDPLSFQRGINES